MTDFRFYHPIEIRYGDLDPQGHVNNARYLTYFEQARISYIRHLGLWKQGSFLDIGIILADAKLTFLAPVQFGQQVKAGVTVTRLGNKSLTMEYQLQDSQTGQALCSGSSVLVAYNYRLAQTVPVPPDWRQAICTFESLEPSQCE
jgi:acyl-CoA thioester hydrolase